MKALVRRCAVAACRGAGGQAISRPASGCSPDASPAASSARSAPIGILPLDGMKWAKTSGKVPTESQPGRQSRRRRLCRAGEDRRSVPPAAGAGNFRRDGRDGSADRPRARDGWRLLLRPEPVQSRDAGAAPAGLVVQAVRLCCRARQRLYAVDHRARCADRDRSRSGHRRLAAGKLRREILRPLDAALRHRAFAQRDDGAAGAGHRHAADRRICQALRRL